MFQARSSPARGQRPRQCAADQPGDITTCHASSGLRIDQQRGAQVALAPPGVAARALVEAQKREFSRKPKQRGQVLAGAFLAAAGADEFKEAGELEQV